MTKLFQKRSESVVDNHSSNEELKTAALEGKIYVDFEEAGNRQKAA